MSQTTDLRELLSVVTDPSTNHHQAILLLRTTPASTLSSGIAEPQQQQQQHSQEEGQEQQQESLQDPLVHLDPERHTLAILFILCARLDTSLTSPGVDIPPLQLVAQLCKLFNPEHARLVPDRVVLLANLIAALAEQAGDLRLALNPLLDIVMRYPPDPSHLTPVHKQLLLVTLTTRTYAPILPLLLNHPITSIYPFTSVVDPAPEPSQSTIINAVTNTIASTTATTTSNQQDPYAQAHLVTSTDVLLYHYLAGLALASSKKFIEAEDYLESAVCICPSAPSSSSSSGQAPPFGGALGMGMSMAAGAGPGPGPGTGAGGSGGVSAIQIEAARRLWLVQLIAFGKILPFPKHTHPSIVRMMKSSVYSNLAGYYPLDTAEMKMLVQREKKVLHADQTLGLTLLAISRAPRWAVSRLTRTYISLPLEDVIQAPGVRVLDLSVVDLSPPPARARVPSTSGGGQQGWISQGQAAVAKGLAALTGQQRTNQSQSQAQQAQTSSQSQQHQQADADGDISIDVDTDVEMIPNPNSAGDMPADVDVDVDRAEADAGGDVEIGSMHQGEDHGPHVGDVDDALIVEGSGSQSQQFGTDGDEVEVPGLVTPGAGRSHHSLGGKAKERDPGAKMEKEQVREMIGDMIANNDFQAHFSPSNPDVIVFAPAPSPSSSSSSSSSAAGFPPTPPSTSQNLTQLLREASAQAAMLKRLEEEWEGSREYLLRAVRARLDDTTTTSTSGGGAGSVAAGVGGGGLGGGGGMGFGSTMEDDDAVFGSSGGGRNVGGAWAEDTQFF